MTEEQKLVKELEKQIEELCFCTSAEENFKRLLLQHEKKELEKKIGVKHENK